VLLGATDMLVCGEDLGFVPACLPPVMQVVCVLGGLEVILGQRWEWECGLG